ncbi:MAG: HpcH/HpaI aldolase/citrate lyase family protein [Verrucomicrobium sp.]
MHSSNVLSKLRSGGVARVCSSGSALPFFPHHASRAGYDAVVLDAEHRPWQPVDAALMLTQCRVANIDSLWRAPSSEPVLLSRVLEDGATGIMMPMVETVDQARAAVQAAHFPPVGNRGLDGSWVDGDFGAHAKDAYVAHALAETLVVLMIESPEGVANADEIAALEGVHVLFIGPGDLSLRLGCKNSWQDPKMRTAIDTVAAACLRHGKALGHPAKSAEDARGVIGLGARFLMMGSETQAVQQHLQACRQMLDEATSVASG